MLKYTLLRLTKFFATIWLIATVTFFLIEPQLLEQNPYCDQRGCGGIVPKVIQRITRFQERPLVQRFFSYMLIDREEGQSAAIGWLDLGLFGVYQVGPGSGARIACGAVCLNFGPSYYRQRGKDVEDILFSPLP